MLDELEPYLRQRTTPELTDVIMAGCNALLEAGVDNHLFLLRNNIDLSATEDFDAVYGGVIGILMPILRHNLREYGVTMTDECGLPELVATFEAINRIEDCEEKEAINTLTDAEEGNEAALADILEIVGDLSSSDYLMVLSQVSTDLITRIAELTSTEDEGPQPDDIAVAAAQTRLRKLLPQGGYGEESIFIQAVGDGLRLGLTFETIIEPHLTAISELPVQAMAKELVAFAYASSMQTDDVLPTLNKLKESFNLSISDLLELDSAIGRLL